jgi:hypothetical protein
LTNVHRLLSIQWLGVAASFFTVGLAQLQVRWRETGYSGGKMRLLEGNRETGVQWRERRLLVLEGNRNRTK